MGALNIILAAAVAAAGFPLGLALARIAKEEIKPGIPYFAFLKKSFLLLAVLIVIASFHLHLLFSILGGLAATIIILKKEIKTEAGYLLLALLFLLSMGSRNMLVLTSSFTFLYGLPAAALIKPKKK